LTQGFFENELQRAVVVVKATTMLQPGA